MTLAQVDMKELALGQRTTYPVQLCRQDIGGLSFGEAAAEVPAPPETTGNQPEQKDQDEQLSITQRKQVRIYCQLRSRKGLNSQMPTSLERILQQSGLPMRHFCWSLNRTSHRFTLRL